MDYEKLKDATLIMAACTFGPYVLQATGFPLSWNHWAGFLSAGIIGSAYLFKQGSLPARIPFKLPDAQKGLTIPIGYTVEGLRTLNMANDSHCYMLVGGNPGTGKSNFLNQVIYSLAQNYDSDQVRFILVDLKLGVEFYAFEGLPQTWLTAYDPDGPELYDTIKILQREIRKRMEIMRQVGVRKMSEYRALGRKMPYLFMVIDEYAEIKNNDKIESMLKSLLQIGRAAGLRAILATQRPTTDNISGSVKALCTDRICFKVASQINSRVVLDVPGAEELPNIPGRAIFLTGANFHTIQTMLYTP